MTQEQIEELKRLEAAATPGPWYSHNPDDEMCMNAYAVTTSPIDPDIWENPDESIVCMTLLQYPRVICHSAERWEEDSAFIAAARDAVPDLIAEVERITKQRDELLEALKRILSTPPGQADGGGFVVDHFDGEGEYIGSQGVDPMWVVQEMASVANAAIAKAETQS